MIPGAKRTQILKALQSNPNWAAVARQVGGVSPATVGAIAHRLGISPSQSGRTKLSAEVREKVAEALRRNPNASAVAREIGGIDPSTVNAIAKKADIRLAAVTIGKTKRLSPDTRARIVEALEANPNASRVAREVGGVSGRTVGKIAKEANIRLAAENPEKTKRVSPEKRARIIEALRDNPNASMVARQIGGFSAKTVQKIAKQAKIEPAAVNGHGAPALTQTGSR
jgi:transposase-like protein